MSLRPLVLTLTLMLAGAAHPAAAEDRWFERALVGMEVGPTGAHYGSSDPTDVRYAAHFDGREIVRRCTEAGAEYLVIWARDGDYAYYNSAILPKPPGLGDRDPLRETVDAAAEKSLPVIAYCVVQQAGNLLRAHPEWEMRAADGTPIGRYCLNSGYAATVEQLLAEQLAYGVAGFHVDMLDQGFGPPVGCWCDACRAAWREQHGEGVPMPEGVTWDEAWDAMLEFRYRTSEAFERRIAAHVRKLAPEATIDFNYHGNPPFSWEVGQRPVQHAATGDFVTGETGVWGFSALGVGLNAEFYRASTPGNRVQVAMQRGVRMYHDQTTRPVADMHWELATLLAHGAFVTMVDKTAFDGRLDPVAYDRIGRSFAAVRPLRDRFGHRQVRQAGLYYSSRSRDWIGRDDPGRWMQSFIGGHKALAYEHVPWGVLLDENLTAERLREYPVVVLCHAGILSDAEVHLLRGYVEAGGGLVATGLSGRMDRLGRIAPSPAWEALSGSRLARVAEGHDAWVSLAADDVDMLGAGIPADWPFLVHGPAAAIVPAGGVPHGSLFAPHRTTRQREGKESTELPMSPDERIGPAFVEHRVGRGRVVTLACSPDHACGGEYHLPESRALLTAAVRMLLPAESLRIEAAATVQAVVSVEPASEALHVHLLAYAAPPQSLPARDRPRVMPGLLESAPIHQVRIVLPDTPASVTAAHPTTEIRQAGGVVDVQMEGVHEVITIRGQASSPRPAP